MTTQRLPYENSTAGDKALQELQRVLEKFGCQNFGTMIDNERQCVVVGFKWKGQQVRMEASWKGYATAWLKRRPYRYRMACNRSQYELRALDQARMSVCSVLRDWVKGQIVALECGILQFEEVFMPHMILTDGRRVLDVAREKGALPQIAQDKSPNVVEFRQ